MASQHLSVRLSPETFARLESESRRTGQTRSQIAKTLLEEGLRMERHPGVIFRSGPSGRRAALYSGPDVWEIARVFCKLDAQGDELIRQTAELISLDAEQVRTALRYDAEYPDEIQWWISATGEYEANAEEAWNREQRLLRS
jgi:hypothetical protein